MSDLIDRRVAIDAIKKNNFRLTVAEEQNAEGHVVWSAYAVYSDVAEGALLALPSAQPEKRTEERTETHACDLISRQAAIDALIRKIRPHNNGDGTITMCVMSEELVRKTLDDLPSAQPEKHTAERTEERTETHACDCISRHEVIYSFEFDDDGTPWNMSDIIYRLEQMPSAQPERKTGKWIDCDGGIATCSSCGDRWGVYGVMKFCPNCGAYMGGEQDGSD